ncbi:demethoxyubiquinone hydroxylase family protein [Legionella quinlivanii]|uniref:demethoxyubiquinone hydroxylase family protein n=1 Tax=Legionella quinlivanii TaxID=45073 RepID=UPI002243F34B|nr:demethoxyubiquinone hydroxylase family protein [Legionella quinlivanii]MCW8449832.1 demethoxyubiquinone hydroxylase family protein [Legionella quinlivanii]
MKNYQGHNFTGVLLEPQNLKSMLNAENQFPPDVPGDSRILSKQRSQMAAEANPVGSIPEAKGKKSNPSGFQLLIDKLGERLAFERSGVRIYDAACAKAKGLNQDEIGKEFQHLREEEAQHMAMIEKAITGLGADPTVMTPCADVSGVLGVGIIQVLTDPRTSIPQTLEALMTVELSDNAAWETLIELSAQSGYEQLAKEFMMALKQEQEHLLTIKKLLAKSLNLKPAKNAFYLVFADEEGWTVKKQGASRASGHFKNKKEAIREALKLSENAKAGLIIHNQ